MVLALVLALALPLTVFGVVYRDFTATISPTGPVCADTVETFTLVVTNSLTTTINQNIGAANVTIPSGFAGAAVISVDAGAKSWGASIVANQILLRPNTPAGQNKLVPGEAVTLVFSATTPSAAGTYTFTTIAGSEVDNWNFAIVGNQPAVEVILCNGCWAGETAWSDGERYVEQGNWARYTSYDGSAKTVTLYAGQWMDAGTVAFSAAAGGEVTITITLNTGWRFKDVAENVKIQDYAVAPTGNPVPGDFAWKFDAADGPFVVPENSFYGVHVDVERQVPCE